MVITSSEDALFRVVVTISEVSLTISVVNTPVFAPVSYTVTIAETGFPSAAPASVTERNPPSPNPVVSKFARVKAVLPP